MPTSPNADSPACPVCHGSSSFYTERNGVAKGGKETAAYRAYQCAACELLFISPTPADALIVGQYEKEEEAEHTRQGSLLGRRIRYRARARKLRARGLGGSVLEIGCGQGDFLLAARAAGFSEVVGVEPNGPVAKFARARGFEVRSELFDPKAFGDRRFDVIATFQVLEHVVDPVEFVRSAATLLKPGGRLVLETPGVDHPRAVKAGRDWRYIIPPWHLNLFGAKSLEALYQRAGLTMETSWHNRSKMYITGVGASPMEGRASRAVADASVERSRQSVGEVAH